MTEVHKDWGNSRSKRSLKGDKMKKLITAILMAFSLTAIAVEQVKSAYIQIERNVKIVITNQPCEKFVTDEKLILGAAYAINTDTGDTVTGCFTVQDGSVYIELSDGAKNHYTYKYEASQFQPTETL
jgi:hypothetical protein